ncbi:DMT family transporter [Pseudoalteromonas sp. R3]|uniref:DMT family transporter n=1 Tax=Pseudoalteromonas sp. R3 TaxID=1709477 RepID=UPI0006B4E764|nr:DMT family transporter [Pseudoalteromonas sp. R3]AZZ96198.1 DMT family transporter [Pseudoalteromonas sp. R3]
MLRQSGLALVAIFSGLLLALMISVNAELADTTSAFQASWIAHGVGGITALLLYCVFKENDDRANRPEIKKQYWFGGVPGALTVVFSSMTVQSYIGLTGTLALALIGQFLFSLIIEHFGLLNQPKTKATVANLLPTLLVATGAMLIIYGRVEM